MNNPRDLRKSCKVVRKSPVPTKCLRAMDFLLFLNRYHRSSIFIAYIYCCVVINLPYNLL